MILLDDLKRMKGILNRTLQTIEAVGDKTTELIPLGKRDMRKCSHGVYFIVAQGTNTVKIGKSNFVRQRLADLQVANPFKLFCWMFINCPSEEMALRIESALHKRFVKLDAHVRGEWFLLRPVLDDFAEYCEPMIKEHCEKVEIVCHGFHEEITPIL